MNEPDSKLNIPKQKISHTPHKMPSKRETRLREFQIRSQRKQGNAQKLLGIHNSIGGNGFSPNRAFNMMNLSSQLDNRNVEKHAGTKLELGNEPGAVTYNANFYRKKRSEPNPIPVNKSVKNISSTIYNPKVTAQQQFSQASFVGGNSNDFNLNKIKINPITGVLSPLNKGSVL